MQVGRSRPSTRGTSWPRRLGLTVLALLLVALVGAFGLSAVVVLNLTDVQRTPLGSPPSSLGVAYEDVTFSSRADSLPLRGWYMPARPAESARSVILVHGESEHRADPNIQMLPLGATLVQHGYNVLTFDLRGHGESAGDRVSFGYYERRDLGGAVDFLAARGRPGNWIGVIGFSMGAATTLLTAPVEPRIRAVVADSSFANFRQRIYEGLPGRAGLPSQLTPFVAIMGHVMLGIDVDALQPERAIASLAPRPVLLVQGLIDDTVAPGDARRLLAAYPVATLWELPNVNHVRAYRDYPEEYVRRVEATFALAQP
jgi:uncharacterized protein